jgi:hypothetical protein
MTTLTSRLDAAKTVPDLYRAMLGLDAAVGKSGLDSKLQELLKYRDALAAGERTERLHVVAGWREAGGWFDERERAALALMEAITRIADNGVPDEIYDAAADQFSEAEMGALVFLGMTINAWTRLGATAKLTP